MNADAWADALPPLLAGFYIFALSSAHTATCRLGLVKEGGTCTDCLRSLAHAAPLATRFLAIIAWKRAAFILKNAVDSSVRWAVLVYVMLSLARPMLGSLPCSLVARWSLHVGAAFAAVNAFVEAARRAGVKWDFTAKTLVVVSGVVTVVYAAPLVLGDSVRDGRVVCGPEDAAMFVLVYLYWAYYELFEAGAAEAGGDGIYCCPRNVLRRLPLRIRLCCSVPLLVVTIIALIHLVISVI